MKKPIICIAPVILILTLVMACNSGGGPNTRAGKTDNVIDFPLDEIKKITGFDPIPYDTADKIYDNYRDKIKDKLERGWLGDDNLPKKDSQSRYMFIEYAKLKQFVDALGVLERQMDSGQYAGAKVSGVRIYFGTYPKNYSNERTKRRLTLVVCGTYLADGKHIDIISRREKKMLGFTADEYQNHGHLCPPDICPGALLDEQ